MLRRLAPVLISVFLLCTAQGSGSSSSPHHFVLVHGAGHGAWCWYKLSSKLQRAGHRVDAIDLLSAGIDSHDPSTIRTLEDYSRPLIQLVQSLPTNHKVVLVGHSLGGDSLTLVMQQFHQRIKAAIFVAANMFPGGINGSIVYDEVIANNRVLQNSKTYVYASGSQTPTAAAFKLDLVDKVLYHRSPKQDVVLAKTLLKPRPLFKHQVINITAEDYGCIPRYYIKTTMDKLLAPNLQDFMLQYNPPDAVFEIAADHSPFFSRPRDLSKFIMLAAGLAANKLPP